MKKLFVALCAVTVLALGACQKENQQTQTPSGNSTPNEPVLLQGEGIFNPGAHIVTVKLEGENSEAWTWSNGKLRKITPYENGSLNEANALTVSYTGDRISQITDPTATLTFTYDSENLATATVNTGGANGLTASVTERANNKIRKIEAGMSGEIINQYINLFSGMGVKSNEKFSCDTLSAEVTLNWTGDNVTRAEIVANTVVTVTLAELAQIPQVAAMIEGNSMAQLAVATMGNMPLDLTVQMFDTVEYTYDENLNPYYWFLGDNLSEFSRLSKANMLTKVAHTSLIINLPESITSVLTDIPSSFDMPLSERTSHIGYEYNDDGFPVKAYTDEGDVEYIYQ